MKQYRKLFALLMALTMLLAGCGGASEEAPEGKNVTLGKVEDGVYSNAYTNVTFAPGEEWQMLGAEDLQDSLQDVQDLFDSTDVEEQLKGSQQIADMQGAAADGTMTVNVIYTKMGAAERAAALAMDEDDYIDAILSQLDTLKDSYEAAGITVESLEKANFVFAGKERVGTKLTGSVSGIPCYILQVYESKLGSYSVVTTMTSFQEDVTEEIAQLFTQLNP